jgi:hypothetical protein
MGVWCLGIVTCSKKDILCFLYLIYIAIRMVVKFRRRCCITLRSGRSLLSCMLHVRVSQLDYDDPVGSKHVSIKVPQIKLC